MKFFVPVHVAKSEHGTGEMRIGGFASTPDLDKENERVMQDGLDISEFLNHGFFNHDHDNTIILGYPDKEKTKITPEGFYVEGVLYDSPEAIRIWNTAVAMEKSKSPKRLGFSIEGRALERDSEGKILKAKVTNVAITPTPVNPNATWNAIVKSMSTSLDSGAGKPLIKESLEGAKMYLNKLEEGDTQAIESLNYLTDRLNKSTDIEDVKLYLMLVKGLHGRELDIKLNEVLEEMNKQEEV